MKVKELIKELQEVNPELIVRIRVNEEETTFINAVQEEYPDLLINGIALG